MRNIILSDEVRERKTLATMNASIANRLPISVKNIKTHDLTSYASLTEAGKALGVTRSAVSQALLNNRLIKKTYSISKTE
jgi:predicted transcriptional regulator